MSIVIITGSRDLLFNMYVHTDEAALGFLCEGYDPVDEYFIFHAISCLRGIFSGKRL